MKTCNPYTWSALAPIKATDDMTHPVGQRDGQLFTAPTGGLPDVTTADNGKIPQVINGQWVASTALTQLTSRVSGVEDNNRALSAEVYAIHQELDGLGAALNALNGEVI